MAEERRSSLTWWRKVGGGQGCRLQGGALGSRAVGAALVGGGDGRVHVEFDGQQSSLRTHSMHVGRPQGRGGRRGVAAWRLIGEVLQTRGGARRGRVVGKGGAGDLVGWGPVREMGGGVGGRLTVEGVSHSGGNGSAQWCSFEPTAGRELGRRGLRRTHPRGHRAESIEGLRAAVETFGGLGGTWAWGSEPWSFAGSACGVVRCGAH